MRFPLTVVLGLALALVGVSSSAHSAEKEWTFLTFLNGFNSLDDFGYLDLNEMEKVGSTDQVNVVVQWASLKTKQVKRLSIKKDADTNEVTSPILENLGRVDMGDYRTLVDSMRWAVKNYPAKHYFINIWNHGNGWHLAGKPLTRDISYDDLSGNRITTEQLGEAVAQVSREIGRKIDIVGSDSCLMAMAEVVAQAKDSIGTFIGSQEVEPAEGWPYDELLTRWNAGGPKTAKNIASILTRSYLDSLPGASATLSGVDLGGYPALASAMRDLAAEIVAQPALVREEIFNVSLTAQSYTLDDYIDLGDLLDLIAANAKIRLRPEILSHAKSALDRYVIANEVSSDYQRSHGVSIWMPHSSTQYKMYQARYSGLVFNRDTNWLDAIRAILPLSML